MRYPHTVTFQAPTEARSASGGVSYTYVDIAALTGLPARIVPVQVEDQADAMVMETDRFTIIVKGDQPVERPMRAVTGYLDGILGVVKVERPVLYRSERTNATIVTAERITASAESGS